MLQLTDQEEDKRIFERFDARFPAKFKDTREDFGTKVTLYDASADGVKISTKERLYLHDSVALEVELPDGLEPMTLKGEVVWVQAKDPDIWDVGLKFHQISLMHLSRLYKFTA